MANTRSICVTAAPYLADTLVPEIIGSITVLTILAVGAVILRFLARSLTNVPYGVDDWLILFALVNIGKDESNQVQMILTPTGLGVCFVHCPVSRYGPWNIMISVSILIQAFRYSLRGRPSHPHAGRIGYHPVRQGTLLSNLVLIDTGLLFFRCFSPLPSSSISLLRLSSCQSCSSTTRSFQSARL